MKRVSWEATRAKRTVWYTVHRVWKDNPSRLALDLLHSLADRWKTAEGHCVTVIRVWLVTIPVGEAERDVGRERFPLGGCWNLGFC